MSKAANILVFDSGVGGLSVLREIQQRVPGCDLFYACDNEAFPYGIKEESELVTRVDAVLKKLDQQLQPDIVVVACNTASTVALPRIRAHFQHPVVGVVPAIKPAAECSTRKVIGLLGTPGTVQRQYTQQLIDDFASDCEVIRIGSSDLVVMAEEKLRGADVDKTALKAILQPFFEHPRLDTIVLACTHFPLLIDELQAIAPFPVNWVDSGEAIARRVAFLLSETDRRGDQPSLLIGSYFTAEEPLLRETFRRFGAKATHLLRV